MNFFLQAKERFPCVINFINGNMEYDSEESEYTSDEYETEEEEETTDEEEEEEEEEHVLSPVEGLEEKKVRWHMDAKTDEEETEQTPLEILCSGVLHMQTVIRQKNRRIQELEQENTLLKQKSAQLEKASNFLLDENTKNNNNEIQIPTKLRPLGTIIISGVILIVSSSLMFFFYGCKS